MTIPSPLKPSGFQATLSNKTRLKSLSGVFSVGWPKTGMAILRDPDQKGMIGIHYQSALHTPEGFGLEPLKAEIQ